MEIRPIKAAEAESFLRLVCEVFDLDYTRAHRVFFTEPLFDLNRKWALFEDGEIRSVLTTVLLEFGWGDAIGIAGVATARKYRGRGLATELLKAVLRAAESDGERGALLFAKDPTLYSRLGFTHLDDVIRGPIQATPETDPFQIMDYQAIHDRYQRWALQDPNRLRRDEKRWGYWRWNLRVCTEFGDGYMCVEGGTLRECLIEEPATEWPLPNATEWLGLETMAKRIGVPIVNPEVTLHLMGRNIPAAPQMFMTDQF